MPDSTGKPDLYPRFITPRIKEALTDTPVVLVRNLRADGDLI
jgi:hypothetical protein